MLPLYLKRTFRPDAWQVSAIVLAGVVIIPVIVIFGSVFQPEKEIWSHLAGTVLLELLGNTFILSSGVLVCTALLGVSLGWLTGACDFPGRSFFAWALTLPMAIPAYVMAFIFVGLMDFTGPVQSAVRLIPGFGSFMVEVRSAPFVIIVLSLSLYPYVYLLSRAAFLGQGRALLEAGRTLGVGPWAGFFRLALPMARPWIVSGLALVLMETLSDFGAVSVFNYDTFTTAVYKAWFGFFSLEAAAQLSSVLVVFALGLVSVEAFYRARMRYYANSRGGAVHVRTRLEGARGVYAAAFCSAIFLTAFVFPVIQLVVWIAEVAGDGELPSYSGQVLHTLMLGAGGAILTCMAALLLSYVKRKHPDRLNQGLCRLSTIGYALPGTVLAVGIFLPVAWVDQGIRFLSLSLFDIQVGPIFQGTLVVMLTAYMVRFLAAGFGAVDSAMGAISPSIGEAASTMGVTGFRQVGRIYLPLLKKGLLTGLILVMVDIVKEMPITLMTRPFGWDTLAVKIFELTSEGEWERAALPGLYLVAASIIPVVVLIRQTEK